MPTCRGDEVVLQVLAKTEKVTASQAEANGSEPTADW